MTIQGSEILNLPINDGKYQKYECKFELLENRKQFEIKLENFDGMYYIEQFFGGKQVNVDYLFCLDRDGIPFTLCDCFIAAKNIPMDGSYLKIRIQYLGIIYGQHFDNVQQKKVRFAEYLVEDTVNGHTYRSNIGNNKFDVLDGNAHICTAWNSGDIDGVKISVEMKTPIFVNEVQKIVLRLLEIYFLVTGFFAEVLERKMVTENQEEFFYFRDYAAFARSVKAPSNIRYVLELKEDTDFSIIYQKWWDIREKECITFNLFAYTTSDTDYIHEVPVATYIQCLEGYFKVHHGEELEKFPDEAKKEIIGEIKKYLEESEKFQNICQKNGLEQEALINSVNGLLGPLNWKSLREVLEYAIGRLEIGQSLFNYEKSIVIDGNKTLFDKFLTKARGHRTWLSHVVDMKKRFRESEVDLAANKLKLLFRLSLLQDIGAEVNESSLRSVIQRIDSWYKEHSLE